MTGEELVVRFVAFFRITQIYIVQFIQEDQAPDRIWDFSFLSPRAYMVTTLKDGGEIRIYCFASRPTHVAKLHLSTCSNSR